MEFAMRHATDEPNATAGRDGNLPAVRTSAEWVAYFRANARRRLVVPWGFGAGLSPGERTLIAGSLPSWQLGESSDGARLLAAARHHAEQTGDPAFVEEIGRASCRERK